MRKVLFHAAWGAFALVPSAWAQTTPPAAGGADVKQVPEEVIVTAQRRAESLQDVPLSVTALSGEELLSSGIGSSTDLTLVVPGLLYGRSTNFNQPAIRGISTRNATSGDEPNVATYLDGVYMPDSIGTPMELSDIESIQVLKGPQGTLYGRNATGGAIILTTRSPEFSPSASFSATAGDFGYYKLSGFLTGPLLGNSLAGSLSAVDYSSDGYIRNINLNKRTGADVGTVVRGKLLWTPTEDLSFKLNGFYSSSSNNALNASYVLDGNTQARTLAGSTVLNPNQLPLDIVVADRPYTTSGAVDPRTQIYQYVGDVHMDWELGWASLSALASVGRTKARSLSSTEASPLALAQTEYEAENKSYNEEVVLTSPGDRKVTWLAGLTSFQSRNDFPLRSTPRNTTTGVRTTSRINYGQDADAAAAFGEVTWEAVEGLFLTGGARYAWDRKTAYNQTNANPRVTASEDFYNFAPRGVVRYEFSPRTSAYFSYTEGYKSGNFNAISATGVVRSDGSIAAVEPEVIRSYEIGYKTELGWLRADLAAFHYDYEDLQVSVNIPDPVTSAAQTVLQNAGAAEINGFEASLTLQPTASFSINATTALMKTALHNFPNAVAQMPRTNLPACVSGSTPTLAGNVTCTLDVGGNELIRAPRYTFSIGGTYLVPLFDGELSLNANAFFSDQYYPDIANQFVQPSYHVVNAAVTWRAPGAKAYVTVFGNNLTDEVYALGHLISTLTTATQAAKPRWFGVTIGYDF